MAAYDQSTIAYRYREIMEKYFDLTVDNGDVRKACGDFSMRGFSSIEVHKLAEQPIFFPSMEQLLFAIPYLEEYYNCNIEEETVGLGTPSTEHSVMCSYGQDEYVAYKRLIKKPFLVTP